MKSRSKCTHFELKNVAIDEKKFPCWLETASHRLQCIFIIAFDEGERILILPWAQAGCQIDLRDFRPGDRLAASPSCATVSDMVTKLCFSCAMMYNFALVSMSWTMVAEM